MRHILETSLTDKSFIMSYEPELGKNSTPLDPNDASYFQYIIGIMQWMNEIGCSLLFSHSSNQQERHLKVVLHIMTYLYSKHNLELIFD